MTNYTNNLTAEQLIQFIANDSVELSYEKVLNQRNWHMKICKEWIRHQDRLKELDPDKRDWEYDDAGVKVLKGTNETYSICKALKEDF